MHLQLWRLWLKSWESRFLEGRPCDLISRNTEFGDIKIHVPGIVLQFWCSAGVAPGLVCELPHADLLKKPKKARRSRAF